jgi:hypothetical protein
MIKIRISLKLEVFEELLLEQHAQELGLLELDAAAADGIDQPVVVLLAQQFGLEQFEDGQGDLEEGVVALAEPEIPDLAKWKATYATTRRLKARE